MKPSKILILCRPSYPSKKIWFSKKKSLRKSKDLSKSELKNWISLPSKIQLMITTSILSRSQPILLKMSRKSLMHLEMDNHGSQRLEILTASANLKTKDKISKCQRWTCSNKSWALLPSKIKISSTALLVEMKTRCLLLKAKWPSLMVKIICDRVMLQEPWVIIWCRSAMLGQEWAQWQLLVATEETWIHRFQHWTIHCLQNGLKLTAVRKRLVDLLAVLEWLRALRI